MHSLAALAAAAAIAPGYWSEDRSAPILAKVETIRLAPDVGGLGPAERAALGELLEAGQIFQDLYESSKHHQALAARRALVELDAAHGHPKRLQNLLTLYRLSQGPIATTLENAREPFLPVAREVPGRNVYPLDASREEIEAFLRQHPDERPTILAERTVVRRGTAENRRTDLATLSAHPSLELLHPRLRSTLADERRAFYAVPYALAYAPELTRAYQLLQSAATHLEASDDELAGYLRNRSRDLLTNDYESGDASWVTGRFKRLNAQIGAYETYDDALFGVKAFHSMSILMADAEATSKLRQALAGVQAIEDALPYESDKRVREDIPVGVYHVIADFGQARGTNTATILPNDALYSRRYGRTILLRANIMEHPEIDAAGARVWRAATLPAHANDRAASGNTQRTLWHEIGHYLGPERDRSGRPLDAALEEHADALEEMKSDLVSLFAHQRISKGTALRAVQASGIQRTLQNVRPRSDQPYQRMQLAQFNWFVDRGLIVPDATSGQLAIRYERYPDAVDSLLKAVLEIQAAGDKAKAAQFFERWTTWTPELHERLAARIREAQGPRWRIVRYAALGE